MSENKITIGFMAELVTPVGNYQTEEWEALQEKLYASGTGLELAYVGTLIFSKVTHVDAHDFSLLLGNPSNPDDFVKKCADAGLPVKAESVLPYFSHWYNGSDSPMSAMSLTKFKEG